MNKKNSTLVFLKKSPNVHTFSLISEGNKAYVIYSGCASSCLCSFSFFFFFQYILNSSVDFKQINQKCTVLDHIFNSFGDSWKWHNGDNFLTLSIYAFTEEQRKSIPQPSGREKAAAIW